MLKEMHLEQIMRQASRARIREFLAPLKEAMARFEIDANARRAAAFIAQLAHESGQLQFMEEIWGPTPAQRRYEPPSGLAKQLGNTQKGDGKRFKGRGPIQVTGRFNYQRYGEALGIDMVTAPELAAMPEAGFAVAGLYWDRNGLNALADLGDFEKITRRINGGLNGQADRLQFYERALAVLAPVFPAAAAAHSRAKAAPATEPFARGAEAVRADGAGQAAPPARKTPKKGKKAADGAIKERKFDVRRDTLDFRDIMYVPSLIEVPTHIPLGDYLDHEIPILDQGSEGACTGYGLATVANYLLLRRRVLPDPVPVSPRMIYHMAKRYDEWPGDDYEGSSARGAMKGWHKHGICREAVYPSSGKDKGASLSHELVSDARRRPLGAYFRVNHKDLVAMHSAIAEVGVLYATSVVHQGWLRLGSDGVIELSEDVTGAHAFAIVAYDEDGFWIQNSWGPEWGMGGFARISYDDWLNNGTDVWVARLGAPVTLRLTTSTAAAHAAFAGESAAYVFSDLRPHIISVGNDGRLREEGNYGLTKEELGGIFKTDIPAITQNWKRRRILLYAHGGLVSEEAAVQRLAEYRPALLQNEIYPLAFVWKTDYWTTLTNMLRDAMRRRRPEGVLDDAKDFMLDRLDDALEPLARAFTGKSAWDEMKENALAASNANGAAALVVAHLEELSKAGAEVHLVGHSAGAIFLGPVIPLLAKAGIPIQTCTLWAPACHHDLFDNYYLPAIDAKSIRRFALYVLSDRAEQDDHCARIYNKSLLYLVSHAFEEKARIPGFRDGEPLLGMERWLTPQMRTMLDRKDHQLVVAPNDHPPSSGQASRASEHGAFDDDENTVKSTFLRILGLDKKELSPGALATMPTFKFRSSASSLRNRRNQADAA